MTILSIATVLASSMLSEETGHLESIATFKSEPDRFEEDGTVVFYIDVSPEEWERTYFISSIL